MGRVKTPAWLASRSARVALFGFVLNLAGVLGAAFWLGPAEQAENDAARAAVQEDARSRAILAANAADEFAIHFGGTAFGITLPPDAPMEAVKALHDIRLRALMHERDGVRGYLALLGIAGAIDYPAQRARFEELVAAERANFTLETFQQANAFEGTLAMDMVKAQGAAAMKAITLRGDRTRAKAVARERRAILLAVSLAGSTILFLATMAGAGPRKPAPSVRLLGLAAARLGARA